MVAPYFFLYARGCLSKRGTVSDRAGKYCHVVFSSLLFSFFQSNFLCTSLIRRDYPKWSNCVLLDWIQIVIIGILDGSRESLDG